MAALERVPCPEPSIPPRYQRLWIRRGSGGSPARPLSHLGPPPCPLHISPGLGQAREEDGWRGLNAPQRRKGLQVQGLILLVGTSLGHSPHMP